MVAENKKKLPRMYYLTDSAKEQIKKADQSSIDSADPMVNADYVANEDLSPLGKLKGKGAPKKKK